MGVNRFSPGCRCCGGLAHCDPCTLNPDATYRASIEILWDDGPFGPDPPRTIDEVEDVPLVPVARPFRLIDPGVIGLDCFAPSYWLSGSFSLTLGCGFHDSDYYEPSVTARLALLCCSSGSSADGTYLINLLDNPIDSTGAQDRVGGDGKWYGWKWSTGGFGTIQCDPLLLVRQQAPVGCQPYGLPPGVALKNSPYVTARATVSA